MVIPINIPLELWAATIIEDFPSDNIPVLGNKDSWKAWGDLLAQENSFSANAAPGTERYSDPFEWAMAVYSVMSIS